MRKSDEPFRGRSNRVEEKKKVRGEHSWNRKRGEGCDAAGKKGMKLGAEGKGDHHRGGRNAVKPAERKRGIRCRRRRGSFREGRVKGRERRSGEVG